MVSFCQHCFASSEVVGELAGALQAEHSKFVRPPQTIAQAVSDLASSS